MENYSKGERKIVGIYKIINTVNAKIYVGSSTFVQSRLRLHKSHLKTNKHCNSHLQSSFNKYGEDNFLYEIIEECEENSLIEKEEFWIKELNSSNNKFGYNIRIICDTNIGLKRTAEQRQRMSDSKKGKCFLSKEHYEKLVESKRGKPNLGAKLYFESLSEEEIQVKTKKASTARQQKAVERGTYNTPEGTLSYKQKRGMVVYQYDDTFNLLQKFLTISDALKFLNMSAKNTSCIKNQLNNDKLYKNYYWYDYERTSGNISNELGELLETPVEDNQQPSINLND